VYVGVEPVTVLIGMPYPRPPFQAVELKSGCSTLPSPMEPIIVVESPRTDSVSTRLFQTLVEGKTVHGAGFEVGAGVGGAVGTLVGVAVGTAVGAEVGTTVGAVVGLVVGIVVGIAVGPAVGAVVGLGERPGFLLALGPLPAPLDVLASRTASQGVEPGMAVGPITAGVIEPAIDEGGPPIAAPVGVAPRPAEEASARATTENSASSEVARGDRRSMRRIVSGAPTAVDGEVVRGTIRSEPRRGPLLLADVLVPDVRMVADELGHEAATLG